MDTTQCIACETMKPGTVPAAASPAAAVAFTFGGVPATPIPTESPDKTAEETSQEAALGSHSQPMEHSATGMPLPLCLSVWVGLGDWQAGADVSKFLVCCIGLAAHSGSVVCAVP